MKQLLRRLRTSASTWSRVDQVFLETLIVLAVLPILVIGVITPVIDGITGSCWEKKLGGEACAAAPRIDVRLNNGVELSPRVQALPPDVATVRKSQITVEVPGVTPGQRRLYAASGVVAGLLTVGVAFLLFLLVRSLRTNPFSRANYWRLVAMGFLILVGGVVQQILEGMFVMDVLTTPPLRDIAEPSATLHMPVLLAVIPLIVAEFFRRAAALREELETVV